MADDDITPVDGNKLIADAANAGQKPAGDKPQEPVKTEPSKDDKPKDDDWKAKFEDKDKQFREYQSGITPKLQKLAEYEKRGDFVNELVEKLSGKTNPAQQTTETSVDDELREVERDIESYKTSGFDENTYEVRNLIRQKNTLIRLQRQERESKERRSQEEMIGDYVLEHKDVTPDHVAELTEIVAEKRAKGKTIDLLIAEEIWQGRHADKVAAQKAKDAATTQTDAGGARTQDGSVVEPTKPDEQTEYRNVIAPPDNPSYSIRE